MRALLTVLCLFLATSAAVVGVFVVRSSPDPAVVAALDERLRTILDAREFTGRIESTLETRLGRPVDSRLAEVGRLLFFDPILSLTRDNSCSGCHGPNVSFNDSKSIAIGVGNNGIVGPGRRGPHNQRRAPSIINVAFFPRLMWDSRFEALSIDPFRNDKGFSFPPPDGLSLSHMEHLLGAQAFTPVINRVEMAGNFVGDHEEMRREVTTGRRHGETQKGHCSHGIISAGSVRHRAGNPSSVLIVISERTTSDLQPSFTAFAVSGHSQR